MYCKFSVGLSKESGFILFHTRYKVKNNATTFPYKRLYTLELDFGPFPPDVAHFLPNDL